MNNQQSEELVLGLLGDASINDPSSLVNILKASGYNATSDMSNDQLLTMSLKAMKDSNKFKAMLTTYLQKRLSQIQSEMSSFSGDGSFLNADAKYQWLIDLGKNTAPDVLKAGVQYGSAKLQSNANKGSEQRAIELAKEQTKQAQANVEAARLAAEAAANSNRGGGASGGASGGGTSKPKWVVPVIIGASVLVLGVVVFMVVKKKK
jgi:hypothetical protein